MVKLLIYVLIALLVARRLPYRVRRWLFSVVGITAGQSRLDRGVFAFLQGAQRAPTTGRRNASAQSRSNRIPPPLNFFGLDERATLAELEAAYRRRALATHPDQGGSEARFKETQRQFELARAWIIETAAARGDLHGSQRR